MPRKNTDNSGFRVTLADVARVNVPKKRRSKGKKMPTASDNVLSVLSQDKQFVLFLMPDELFVWTKMLEHLRLTEDGEVRLPVPRTNAAIKEKWQPPSDIDFQFELDALLDQFVDSRIIEKVGPSGNGHETYRFLRNPGIFHVITIKSRELKILQPEYTQAIRNLQSLSGDFFKQAPFSKRFKEWLVRNHSTVNPGSAYVNLVNYRPSGQGGWGVLVGNPDIDNIGAFSIKKERPDIQLYLVAYPGFEAYRFITTEEVGRVESDASNDTADSDDDEDLDDSKDFELSDENPGLTQSQPPIITPAPMPAAVLPPPPLPVERVTVTLTEKNLNEPEEMSAPAQEPPQAEVYNDTHHLSLTDEQLREEMQKAQDETARMERALRKVRHIHAVCKAELKLRLAQRIKAVTDRASELQKERDRLENELQGL